LTTARQTPNLITMKNALTILFLLLMTTACIAADAPKEVRGAWVNAWGLGLRSKAQISEVIGKAKAANLNTLFVQVRRRGDSLYYSSLVPRCPVVPTGFDPLAEVIRQGTEAGIEIHAWLPLFPAWSDQAGKPPEGHVLLDHPEWITWGSNGKQMSLADGAEGVFLDPGVSDARAHLIAVVREIATRYPLLNGIHLDYVRYPSSKWGYHPEAVRRFREETGSTPTGNPAAFSTWRRNQVTSLVREVAAEVRDANKDLMVSASVFADRADAVNHRLQNWPAWLSGDNALDFVVAMNYATKDETFNKRMAECLRVHPDKVMIGIGSYNKSTPASLKQVRSAQTARAKGIVLYDTGSSPVTLWKELGKGPFKKATATAESAN
jgi:uncharacterized lipoprotein YddW (UPF0748 family)